MALTVCDSGSEVDASTASVRIESNLSNGADAITELRSVVARQMAIKWAAAKGLPDPRVNGNVDVFPVDFQDAEIKSADQVVSHYVGIVPLTKRLV